MSGLQPGRLAQNQVLGPTGILDSKWEHPGMGGGEGLQLGGGSLQDTAFAQLQGVPSYIVHGAP